MCLLNTFRINNLCFKICCWQAPNERELHGILNHVAESRPSTSPTQYHFCMGVLELLARFDLNSSPLLALQIECVHSHFVDTLLESWKSVKADTANEKLLVFRKMHAGKLSIIFQKTDIDLIFEHLGAPQNAKDAVYACCERNLLGKSMFGETLQSVLSSKTSSQIELGVLNALQGQRLDSALWKATCRAQIEAATAVDPSKLMRCRRKVFVCYRGVRVLLKVSSLLQEVEFWLAAKLREKAVAEKEYNQLLF